MSKKAIALAAINKLNQSKGYNIISADEMATPYWLRRPTGIMQLDIDIGGGVPSGGISQIMGADNSGKSMVLFHIFAQQQRILGEDCVLAYAPTEGPPDYMFMRKCGCMVAIPAEAIRQYDEIRKERGLKPFTKEEKVELSKGIGTFHLIQGDSGEIILESVLDLVKLNAYDVIGIDSMTVIMPEEEQNKEMEDNIKKATHASLVTRFINKWHNIMNKCTSKNTNYTAVVATEQVRANQDKGMYNPAEYKPILPYSSRHGASVNMYIKSESKIRSTKSANKNEVIGKTMKWEILKGKHGSRDGIKGELDLLFERFDKDEAPIDVGKTVLTAGVACGVITDKGGTLCVKKANGENMALGIPSVDDFLKKLNEDVQFDLAVRTEIVMKHKSADYYFGYKQS